MRLVLRLFVLVVLFTCSPLEPSLCTMRGSLFLSCSCTGGGHHFLHAWRPLAWPQEPWSGAWVQSHSIYENQTMCTSSYCLRFQAPFQLLLHTVHTKYRTKTEEEPGNKVTPSFDLFFPSPPPLDSHVITLDSGDRTPSRCSRQGPSLWSTVVRPRWGQLASV